jgi:nucleotide-binding universal stress UspA family protein
MAAIRKILFAVKDPDSRKQRGIDKAIHIAKRLGASIELFHAISTPVFLEIQPLTGTSLGDLRREALELRQRRLEAHAVSLSLAGSLRGSLHAMHSNYPAVFGQTLGDPAIDTVTLAATYDQQTRKDSADFKTFAEKAGIPRARRHEVNGDPIYGIPKVARGMRVVTPPPLVPLAV